MLFQALAPLFSQEEYSPETQKKTKKQFKQGSERQQKVQFKGVIKNGTGSALKPIPDVELIRLAGGMQLIEKTRPQKAFFEFSPIFMEEPKSPYLIRTVYQGASYSVLIAPKKEFWKGRHGLYVYDSGAELKDLQITSALQVTKKREGLSVEKVFIVQNSSSPPKSFGLEQIYFFIPPKSKDIRASIRYQNKGMALPLKPLSHKQGYNFKHGLRPGQAELNIRYEVFGYQLRDRTWLPSQAKNRAPQVLIWRPPDASPKVKGAKYSSINIPKIGPAYQIEYELENEINYDFSSGSVIIEDPLNEDSNPLFDHPGKTLAALFVILTYFLLLTRFAARRKYGTS